MNVTLLLVALISFLLNIPLGIWRTTTRKLSAPWFLAIHLTVPLIYYLRVTLDLKIWTAPVLILMAVLGQITGGHLQKKKKHKEQNKSI